jgi:hypothetical protein
MPSLIERRPIRKDVIVGIDESSSIRSGNPAEDPNVPERRGRRVAMNCRLFFFGDDELEGEASLLDISTHGCRATSLIQVSAGLTLKLTVFLQDQKWPLRIDAALVRWVDGQTFGLEFVGIRPAQRERLRTLVMKTKL